ncbi:MAG: rod shape-determining protein RodA [Gemmatimonadetes bacterium]|nr:rod shape-determining protein RodA [Gemmatimonadota bacterium]
MGLKTSFEHWAIDAPLVGLVLGLSVVGVAMIYSAGQLEVPSAITVGIWKKQLAWLLLSLVAFAAVVRIPLRWFEWAAYPAYAFAVALLGLTLAIGSGAGTAQGVRSWLGIGGLHFQPAEFAKLATILALARVLAARQEPPATLRELVPAFTLVAVPLGLVVLQPDLGTALVFVAILFTALYWAGTPVTLLVLLASPGVGLILSFDARVFGAYVVVLALFLYLHRYRLYLLEMVAVVLANLAAGTIAEPLWNSLEPYQRARLLVFLDPAADPRGAGWHLIQSKVAIGSGGLLGKGFTLGTQKRYAFLPEQHTDFIFSVVGEEFGFLGTLVTLLLFAFLLRRLVRTAELAPDPFAALVVFGIFGAWLAHVVINVGMTIGFLPITGLPLPFLSYGGSFLLMSFVALATAVRVGTED